MRQLDLTVKDLYPLLEEATQEDFDSLVSWYVQDKKKEYKQFGNSDSIVDSIDLLFRIGSDLAQADSSPNWGLLHKLKARLILESSGSTNRLELASTHIQKAIDHLSLAPHNDSLVSSHLIRAVVYKVKGEREEAFYSLRKSKQYLTSKEISSEKLIMLDRQEQMMLQSTLSHEHMFRQAIAVRENDPIEFYGSIKRVFEFYMNREFHDERRKLYPILVISFNNVRGKLPLISRVSFMKIVGQHLILDGQRSKGLKVLTVALRKAIEHGFYGQVNQLQRLYDDAHSGSKLELVTLQVSRAE